MTDLQPPTGEAPSVQADCHGSNVPRGAVKRYGTHSDADVVPVPRGAADAQYITDAGASDPPPRQRMTDEEREEHIQSCGRLMEAAMERWERDGLIVDRGDADRWHLLMVEAIKARSPAQVARMERERGLS